MTRGVYLRPVKIVNPRHDFRNPVFTLEKAGCHVKNRVSHTKGLVNKSMDHLELVTHLDNYLQIAAISDYGPQGLQVEAANNNVQRVALAVDTSPATIEAAAMWRAGMLLVHHGILWRSVERIAGPLGKRVRLLLENNIHLYAAHLALDAHPEVGNNAVLARMIGMQVDEWWCDVMGTQIGVIGRVDTSLQNLVTAVNDSLNTQARPL